MCIHVYIYIYIERERGREREREISSQGISFNFDDNSITTEFKNWHVKMETGFVICHNPWGRTRGSFALINRLGARPRKRKRTEQIKDVDRHKSSII